MINRFVMGLLSLLGSGFVAVAADPVPETTWTLPKADADKWVTRIRLLARDGWTVSVRGNDVIVQRNKAVRFERAIINGPSDIPGVEPLRDLREGVFRLTLRFAPKMSIDEYERLAAVNAASDREHERLHRAVGLTHKFDDFIATTPEEKTRVKAYREAVAKLPRHTLPDLYTPDHSIILLLPFDGLSYMYDKDVAAECHDVQENMLRYFGMYDPIAARKGTRAGRHEPLARP